MSPSCPFFGTSNHGVFASKYLLVARRTSYTSLHAVPNNCWLYKTSTLLRILFAAEIKSSSLAVKDPVHRGRRIGSGCSAGAIHLPRRLPRVLTRSAFYNTYFFEHFTFSEYVERISFTKLMLKHQKIPCDHCGKEYIQLSHLSKHKASHTEGVHWRSV